MRLRTQRERLLAAVPTNRASLLRSHPVGLRQPLCEVLRMSRVSLESNALQVEVDPHGPQFAKRGGLAPISPGKRRSNALPWNWATPRRWQVTDAALWWASADWFTRGCATSVGLRQSAASTLLPAVAILPALLFPRWPLPIFCWSSSLRHMAPNVPH